ncbi:MAG: NAD-dependent dihydropyrimidine dehydrogenase subunit PreA [Thermoleophilia bacterium]|nr:NAD-dependent dihydropyrimidine dehydrogenase subunit PreA [Thermoleophilia bacterium]
MADLSTDTAGIHSPNPFWIASGPPGNSLRQVRLAFEAGWGGVVWKTVGGPVIDTAMRYGGLDVYGRKLVGLNNIELISDRPIEVNFAEIAQTKEEFPDRAVVVSLMVETERQAWHEVVKRAEQTGCDGFELNFGCPHGMSERNMGAAVGQVPEYIEMITSWVKEVSTIPVLVKLTPNITNIESGALAAKAGGADGVSAINTINSIVGLDLDTWETRPSVNGKGSHGGYAGPAVKPIALHMVSSIAHNPALAGLPISGIGGAHTWQDVAEFMLLGASTVQVCTAIMHHGFRLVGELETGLSNYLDSKGLASVRELVGGSVERISSFGDLDLNWQVRAKVDPDACIGCGKCIEVCRDNQVDCIDWVNGTVNIGRIATVDQSECIGCDLCSIVCPVTDCITMEEQPRVLQELSWNGLNGQVGMPGFHEATSGITWERFPAEVAGKVDSHGLLNPSTADAR